MLFFYDNRDNADNGLSAKRTELGWRWKLSGFMDYAEREKLQDLRYFVSEASRRIRGCKKEGARWGHPLFFAAGLAAAGGGYSMTSFFVRVLLSVVTRRK